MPVKLGSLLNSIAIKLGVDVSSPEFLELLNLDTDVPDSIATSFNRDVLTLESAKNNAELKRYFQHNIFNPLDNQISDFMQEDEFDETDKINITSIKNTYDKVRAYRTKLKDLENKKANANTSKEKNSYSQQIEQLNTQNLQLKQSYESQINELNNKHGDEIINLIRYNKIASSKIKDIGIGTKEDAIRLAIMRQDADLKEKGIKLVNDNNVIRLKLANDSALDYYNNNKQVSFDDYNDSFLSNNNFLAVNEQPPAPATNGAGRTNTNNYTPNSSGVNKGAALSAVEKSLADYSRSVGTN